MPRVFEMFRVLGSVLLNKHVAQKTVAIPRQLCTSTCHMVYQDEPDYLKYLKPQVPVYDLLNIQIKGYDFTVLEHYAKHVHKIAVNMDLEVTDAWASPHQAFHITNTEPNTSKVAHNYYLNLYERNIQVAKMPAYSAAFFFEIIQSMLPAGVSVSIHPHEKEHEEYRYIPDFELMDLKRKLLEVEANLDESKAAELVEIQKAEKAATKFQPKP